MYRNDDVIVSRGECGPLLQFPVPTTADDASLTCHLQSLYRLLDLSFDNDTWVLNGAVRTGMRP